ncbi:DUF4114 domain-containing protein [Azorhizobium sp. AG788]|uniref:DUF4114 domain-containing protein n=1 Tax=Azorhizobium sp. AG788 TaxID=2183897 RepID=UPI00313946F3
MSDSDTGQPSSQPNVSDPKGGLYGGWYDSSQLDPNVRSVMMDYRWTTSLGGTQAAGHFTYAFATGPSDYTDVPGGYVGPALASTATELSASQKQAVLTVFGLITAYTGVTFSEAASASATDATFRFANYTAGGSESDFPANQGTYAPSDSGNAADTWLGQNGNTAGNFFGTDEFLTIAHEMGHAFGLKHGHDPDYNGALAAGFNDYEFSAMTYAAYLGADTAGATTTWVGSSPISFMMYDIAALQAYYGANFSKVGTTAVYTWDPTTGQQSINGVAAPLMGVTDTGKIFSTVWTQGALTTYDLSAFNENQVDDMRPGQWLTFSRAQIADLNSAAAEGTPEYQARGNVYNSLLYNGDARSAISNLITGNGNDTITGNDFDNIIRANGGTDYIFSGAGNDRVSGGAGADTIVFGSGRDVLFDTLADLNGDVVQGFSLTTKIEVVGSEIAHTGFSIAKGAGFATLSSGGTSFQIHGEFATGTFMSVARGAKDAGHTSFSFETFLPSLSESVQVQSDSINGIDNTDFLTGDGEVGFSVQFQSAGSAYHNTVGAYNISVDGTISNVRILFSDTLAVSQGATVDLGTPADGSHVGFFLIQDGFGRFGGLANDLSFLQSDGTIPTLFSQSRGALSDATIYHADSAYNADGLDHVLSGVSADGSSLLIGFEDLARSSGDNDFQDVVFAVHDTSGYLII